MKTFQLEAAQRADLGKKATKALRREGIIPAVIYGGAETRHLTVTQDAVRNLVYTPEIFDIDLSVAGQLCKAVVKDIQFHPVTDEILHIDFLEVTKDKAIEMEVPVVLEGHAAGVRAGGKLVLEMRKLRVKATYDQIPERLHINVENLELGKTIQVGAVHFDGLEVMNAKNAVVCAVRLTRAARGAAAKK